MIKVVTDGRTGRAKSVPRIDLNRLDSEGPMKPSPIERVNGRFSANGKPWQFAVVDGTALPVVTNGTDVVPWHAVQSLTLADVPRVYDHPVSEGVVG